MTLTPVAAETRDVIIEHLRGLEACGLIATAALKPTSSRLLGSHCAASLKPTLIFARVCAGALMILPSRVSKARIAAHRQTRFAIARHPRK